MRPEDDRRRRWCSIGARTCLAAIVVAVLGAACTSLLAIKDPSLEDAGGGGGSDAASDTAADSAIDAAIDSGIDAAIDAAIDAPIDGPPAQCTTGVCCNTTTGKFEPTTKVCGTTTDFQCAGSSSCGGQPQRRTNEQHCRGDSASCNGQVVMGQFTNLGSACGTNQLCVPQGSAAPQCSTCPFGCDPPANACLPQKLWAFVTDAGSNGAFGAVAQGARMAADIRCENMYNANFTNRACTNIHAVIQIDDLDDTIERMKMRFVIPATAQVFRATDATPVSDKWDTFVDPNQQLLAPVKPATSQVPVQPFWVGRGTMVNCSNWTSNSATAGAVAGDATKVSGWMSLLGPACNNTNQHLLCVCW